MIEIKNMIFHLQDLPSNVVGCRAIGEITEKEFTQTVLPKVKALIDKIDKPKYLLVLETSVKNLTIVT